MSMSSGLWVFTDMDQLWRAIRLFFHTRGIHLLTSIKLNTIEEFRDRMLIYDNKIEIDCWFARLSWHVVAILSVFLCFYEQPWSKYGPNAHSNDWAESKYFGTHQQQFMTNSAMQKLNNNNINYEGTTKMNSYNVLVQQNGAPSHTARNTIIYLHSKKSPLSSLRCGQQTAQTADNADWGALQQQVYCDDCLKLWNSWNWQSWMSGARYLRSLLIVVSMNGDDVWNVFVVIVYVLIMYVLLPTV